MLMLVNFENESEIESENAKFIENYDFSFNFLEKSKYLSLHNVQINIYPYMEQSLFGGNYEEFERFKILFESNKSSIFILQDEEVDDTGKGECIVQFDSDEAKKTLNGKIELNIHLNEIRYNNLLK